MGFNIPIQEGVSGRTFGPPLPGSLVICMGKSAEAVKLSKMGVWCANMPAIAHACISLESPEKPQVWRAVQRQGCGQLAMVRVAHILQDECEVDREVTDEIVACPPRLVQLWQPCITYLRIWTKPL